MSNIPAYEILDVRETDQVDADGKPVKIWTRIGAAWPHGDGRGFSLVLNYIPTPFDGRLVMREPLPAGSDQLEAQEPVPDDDLPF